MPNIPFFLELIWRRRSHWNRYRKISSVNVCKTLKCPFCMFIFFFRLKMQTNTEKRPSEIPVNHLLIHPEFYFTSENLVHVQPVFFDSYMFPLGFTLCFFLVSFMLYVEKCSHWELKLDKIAIEISIMRIGHLFCAQLQHSVRIINEPK